MHFACSMICNIKYLYLHARSTIATSKCLNNLLPPSIWSCVWNTYSKDFPSLCCLGEDSTFSVDVCNLLLPLRDVWTQVAPKYPKLWPDDILRWLAPEHYIDQRFAPKYLFRNWLVNATYVHPYWSHIWFTFVWYFLF